MCGIAGIVRFDDQPVDHRRLDAMLAHAAHRGPDGAGISKHGRCALVHSRLSIIDLLSGDQPMHVVDHDTQGTLHLVFNGEIYNHRELRRLLEQRGHTFRSDHSDTEVLLFGYREWGTQLPKHLHGMFAFAIWDDEKQTLMLARDRVGEKPLYVRQMADQLVFASLPATIVAGVGSDHWQVDGEAMRDYLRFGYTMGRSLLSGMAELAPAHWMTVDSAGQVDTQRYWRPPPISKTSTSLGVRDALDEVVYEAVGARLESDVPLGCFLSGGIDSSLVAAIAQRTLAERGLGPLQTFSVSMPDLKYDESPHAQAVADHIGSRHTRLRADSHTAMDDLVRLMSVWGEPTADSSLLPTFWLCQETRKHVKVALSGDGGDELFGGYDRYRAIRMLSRWRGVMQGLPTGLIERSDPKSRRTRVARLVDAARAGRDPAVQYASMVHLFDHQQIAALMPSLADDTAESGRRFAEVPDWDMAYDPVHAAMRWDLEHYLPYEVLRKVDRASMAVALEVRCPLLDTPVLDLAGHLPGRVLMPGNRPKGVMRQLARTYLPEAICNRKKQGFAVPIGSWFRQGMRDDLHARLTDGKLVELGMEQGPITKLFDEHQGGHADHTHRLFALLQLSLWQAWRQKPTVPMTGIT